jgi:hypothetical protein
LLDATPIGILSNCAIFWALVWLYVRPKVTEITSLNPQLLQPHRLGA